MQTDSIILSLFEGSLICDAGIPVRDMYGHIKSAYKDSHDVVHLFESLENDWQDSNIFLKMVSPFEVLKKENQIMVIAHAFTQLAAGTAMVDVYWGQCGYAYSLAKKIKLNRPTEDDIEFACQLLQSFNPEHEIWNYFFSLSNSPNWQKIRNPTESLPNLEKWSAKNSSNSALPTLRCYNAIFEACNTIGAPEFVAKIEKKWKAFVATL